MSNWREYYNGCSRRASNAYGFVAFILTILDKSWLLVFDNVRTVDEVAEYWPPECSSRASIIITSQKASDWTGHSVSFEPMGSIVGSSLLLQQLGEKEDSKEKELAHDISTMVGGLPVWLHQVGGYIKLSRCTLAEFVQNYQSNVLGGKNLGANWQYEKLISTVFDDAIKELDEDWSALLFMLAFLNPDGVSESMLLTDCDVVDL